VIWGDPKLDLDSLQLSFVPVSELQTFES
jgi:hypothetical protein